MWKVYDIVYILCPRTDNINSKSIPYLTSLFPCSHILGCMSVASIKCKHVLTSLMYLSSYASKSALLGRWLVYLYYYGSIEKESNRMHTLRVPYHSGSFISWQRSVTSYLTYSQFWTMIFDTHCKACRWSSGLSCSIKGITSSFAPSLLAMARPLG